MNKRILGVLMFLVAVSVVYTGVSGSADQATQPSPAAEQVKPAFEPAEKFVPTDKLRADDAVSFPVDI